MYDVCIRKNRHGDWVAVIRWSVWEEGRSVQKSYSSLPYPAVGSLLKAVQSYIEIQEAKLS